MCQVITIALLFQNKVYLGPRIIYMIQYLCLPLAFIYMWNFKIISHFGMLGKKN
jgi:hypothetical protein